LSQNPFLLILQFIAMQLLIPHFKSKQMGALRKIMMSVIFIFATLLCFLQTHAVPRNSFSGFGFTNLRTIIKGKLLNERGEPLTGCTVSEKGTQNFSQSAADGSFTIDVAGPSSIIIISYVGYETQEVKVGSLNNYTITLVPSASNMDQVVVVGYSSQKKATVTGAISTVKGADLIKSPVPNLTAAVVGRVPGLLSVQRSGQPGNDETTLRIRGIGTLDNSNAAPLVLVDGVERPFSRIDPNEVESISVLKDAASTAVYGIRGANGVILVTTLKGKEGPAKVNYTGNYAVQVPTRLPKFLDGYDFSVLQVEAQLNDNPTVTPMFSKEELQIFKDGSDPLFYPNIDWLEFMMHDYAPQQQHNVNISGGTSVAKYFVSLGYLDQEGLWKQFAKEYNNNDLYKKFNFRSNLDLDISKTTKANIQIGGFTSNRSSPGGSPFLDILAAATNGTPGMWEGKVISLARANGRNALGTFFDGFDRYSNSVLNLNVGLKQKFDFITKGLSGRLIGAYDSEYGQSRGFSRSFARYSAEKIDVNGDGIPDPILRQSGEDGVLNDPSESFTRSKRVYLEAAMEYNNTFGKHALSGLLLYTQRKQFYHALSYPGIPLGYQDFVTRFTYNYDQKYLLEFNMGRNGSENFPVKSRFGWFPAVSGGWVVTNEPFVKNLIGSDALSYFKLRASYGVVGNDRMGTSRFLYFPSEYLSGGGAIFGEDPVSRAGYYEGKLGNPNVTWEKSLKQNYAAEFRFIKNKLTLNLDYFIEARSNILTARRTVPTHVAAVLQDSYNIGSVENGGYEIELGWNDKIGKSNYWLRGNYSFARNKILFMDEAYNTQYPLLNQTGQRVGEVFGYTFMGFFNSQEDISKWPRQFNMNQRPGDLKYADVTGDGIVDVNDRSPIMNPSFPEINYGFSGGFTIKKFDFSFLFQGAANMSMSLGFNALLPFSAYGSAMDFIRDRWYAGSPDNNATAKIPRLTLNYADLTNYYNSSLWVRDASYLRLRNVQIAYNLNGDFLRKIGANSMRVFVSGQNLLTWDTLKFIDPENVATGSMTYPQLKVFNFGVNLQF
jgi:TonB-linked SusC/RagA family outer membrane protein